MLGKRSMGEVEVPSPSPSGEGQLTSSRGRVVKPRTWEDNAEPPIALAGSRLQRTTTPNKEPQGSPEGDRPPMPPGRQASCPLCLWDALCALGLRIILQSLLGQWQSVLSPQHSHAPICTAS